MVPEPSVPGPDFRILGPIEVLVEGRQVPVPAGAQRTLLGMLLLSRGRAVSVDRLLDGLWGEEQPQDPRASLHTAVARLRRTLAPTGALLRTVAPGYALDVDPGRIDADRFSDLHARARVLLEGRPREEPQAEDVLEALALLRAALDLWRGPAWGELAEGVASGDALRLEEARVVAREDLATALLRAGRVADAVSTLESLVLEHPLRDRSVGLLVDALHRFGRTADALTVYGGYRDRLADELGLDPSPPLVALHQRVLRQELPEPATTEPDRPRAAAARPTRRETTAPLIGRDEDVSALSSMLETGGLVTLVGPGGVGKSRLARHVADNDGPAFWVDLVPVRDSAGVVQATAEALGVEARSGKAVAQALRDRLASEPDLVVLDNCEHVLDAVAEMLSTSDARAATVVATSRERLGVAGERVYVVDPLGLPAAGTADVDAPAVQLFVARARDAGVDLTGDSDVLRRVGEVCRALDGLPLALELGAARMGTLTIEDLAERLDRRFELLTRGPRTAPRRHRTLRSVVDWSYDLLDEEERAVFTRLAVFPSGFDLAAAEAVVSDEAVDPDRVADVVAQLADRSMVVRPSGVGKGKYRLLESLRQYAVSRLASEELARARRRHAVWAVALAERARRGLEGPDEARCSRLLDDVLDDLRAAWRWSREAEEPDTAERLLAATWRWAHWRFRADVLRWGAQLVSESPAEAPLVAYTAAAGCAWLEGELDEVDRVVALAATRFEDEASRGDLFEILGDVSLWRGATARAAASYARAEQIRREEGDVVPQSIALSNEVLALVYAGRPWEQTVDEALALAVSTGNPTAIAFARYAEGEACAEEDAERAVTALEEALRLAESVGNRLITGVAMTALVALRGRTAAVEPATFDLFRRVIVHWATTRNPALLVTALRNLVILLARVRRFEDAAELWSSIQSIDTAHPSYGVEAVRLDAALAAARDALGPAFDVAVVRGRGHVGITGVSAHAQRLCADESVRTAGSRPTGASTSV